VTIWKKSCSEEEGPLLFEGRNPFGGKRLFYVGRRKRRNKRIDLRGKEDLY